MVVRSKTKCFMVDDGWLSTFEESTAATYELYSPTGKFDPEDKAAVLLVCAPQNAPSDEFMYVSVHESGAPYVPERMLEFVPSSEAGAGKVAMRLNDPSPGFFWYTRKDWTKDTLFGSYRKRSTKLYMPEYGGDCPPAPKTALSGGEPVSPAVGAGRGVVAALVVKVWSWLVA